MNQEDRTDHQAATKTSESSYALPVIVIVVAVLLEASAKPIAKALATGLQDRANIEGTIAVVSILGLVVGIGLAVRTFLARKKQD